MAQLIDWAEQFSGLGFTPSYGPGDHGNMSVRTEQGFIMSARATSKARLRPEQFVNVVGVENRDGQAIFRTHGAALPSTDALLHHRLYSVRPDVHAILHGHDRETLARAEALGLSTTAHSAALQSLEVIEDACRLAMTCDYFLLRDHGFLVLGRQIEEAGRRALLWADRARTETRAAPP